MKVTMQKLAAAIQSGRGTGTGDQYRPWIEVTRRTSSPCSNVSVVPVPYLVRLTHYLSRAEREFALFIWWLGALDVREQYPLWPWPHLHPETQLGRAQSNRFHIGMKAVAHEAGIKLGDYPGLGVPWIVSIDLLVTVAKSVNPARLVGISCKPKEVLENGSPSDRELERLELDRLYCRHAEIPFRLAHPEQLPRDLLVQLHWLAPIESRSALAAFTGTREYKSYVERLSKSGYEQPAWIASREAGEHVGWPVCVEQRAMKIAIWHQHVDVDVSKPVVTTNPFAAGGVTYRNRAKNKWLGVDQ